MSSWVMPARAKPWSSRKWSTTPSSAATVLPFMSATDLIDWSQMMASFPAELSLTTTIACFEPAATAAMVSFRVCVLASSLPADMASSDET